jgi:hypothetical protein
MTKTSWQSVAAAGLLLAGSMAQAGLITYNSAGADLVLDGQGLTWTADANLFKTQYDADNNVVNDIIAAVPTITHTPGGIVANPYTVTSADFNTTDGSMSWFGAMAWAEWLGITGYGGANDWRLWSALNSDGSGPDFGFDVIDSELGHLFYTEGGLSQGDSINDSTALTDVFTNMQDSVYWSGTESGPNHAWLFDFNGFQFHRSKDFFQFYGWAVRPGQVDVAALDAQPVPTPATLWLVGAGLLGLSLKRRRCVLRRFV